MPEQENDVKDIMKYMGTEERPVGTKEMMEFWKSLTNEEKAEFKKADLTK